MIIGGVYREHQYILQDNQNDSDSDANQLIRWSIFVQKWRAAARNHDVTVIGDFNLDFLHWGAPKA